MAKIPWELEPENSPKSNDELVKGCLPMDPPGNVNMKMLNKSEPQASTSL